MNDSTSRTLELVVFKLRDGVSREHFLGTSGGVTDWVREQPGFISRELSYDAESDRWVDVVWWNGPGEAKAAAERAMSSASCAPMFSLIDMDAMTMIHAEVAA